MFQLESLDFCRERLAEGNFPEATWQLGAYFDQSLPDGLIHLGGERRGAWMEKADREYYAPPLAHLEGLAQAKEISLTLCSLGLFDEGWKPAWLDDTLQGVLPDISGLRVQLLAVANERWQGISGWDLANKQPKPGRRAVPAGSTYWFRVLEQPADPNWTARLWLHSISDRAQDRRDGWGIVLPRLIPAAHTQNP